MMFKKAEKLNLNEKLKIKDVIEILMVLFLDEKGHRAEEFKFAVESRDDFIKALKKHSPTHCDELMKRDGFQEAVFFIGIYDVLKDKAHTLRMSLPSKALNRTNKGFFYARLFKSLRFHLNSWYQQR